MMRNRHLGSNLGLLLLAAQVFQLGTDNIPPVTLATLGLNVYLFLFPLKPLLQACLSVQEAYQYRDWTRLLMSPFHHVDDMHLYFNMASLLWKGIKLEKKLGGAWFAYLLSVFSLLTGLVYLLLEVGLTQMMDDSEYSLQCMVGFSGVLFGLKVVKNHYYPGGVSYVMGLSVSGRYACWVELILIHIMNPGTSFVAHLSGILVGLLYTHGPLKSLMKSCADFVASNGSDRKPQRFNSSGYSGYGMPCSPNSNYGQQSFYSRHYSVPFRNPAQHTLSAPAQHTLSAPAQHSYTAGQSEEEQYKIAIRASLSNRASAQMNPSHVHSDTITQEIRWRRLQKFSS